jgi:hypothetical protein
LIRSSIDLKKALDSSFSDAAAAQAYGQTFNPILPTAKNIEKLEFLINDLAGKKKSQAQNFRDNGYKVSDDLDGGDWIRGKKAQFDGLKKPEDKNAFIIRAAKQFKMTEDEVKEALGVK